jgi:hypothetical protein
MWTFVFVLLTFVAGILLRVLYWYVSLRHVVWLGAMAGAIVGIVVSVVTGEAGFLASSYSVAILGAVAYDRIRNRNQNRNVKVRERGNERARISKS